MSTFSRNSSEPHNNYRRLGYAPNQSACQRHGDCVSWRVSLPPDRQEHGKKQARKRNTSRNALYDIARLCGAKVGRADVVNGITNGRRWTWLFGPVSYTHLRAHE